METGAGWLKRLRSLFEAESELCYATCDPSPVACLLHRRPMRSRTVGFTFCSVCGGFCSEVWMILVGCGNGGLLLLLRILMLAGLLRRLSILASSPADTFVLSSGNALFAASSVQVVKTSRATLQRCIDQGYWISSINGAEYVSGDRPSSSPEEVLLCRRALLYKAKPGSVC